MRMWSEGSRHPQACACLGIRQAKFGGAEGLFLSHSRIRARVSSVVSCRGDSADCGGKSNTPRLEPRHATDFGVVGS
jgi:hypothetical protein